MVVTSPPYFGLRSYLPVGGHPDKAREIGLDSTPAEYVADLVAVFREIKRVLRDDGVAWLNLGDSYNGAKAGNTNGTGGSGLKRNVRDEATRLRCLAENKIGRSDGFKKTLAPGLKTKDLIGVPWRVAFALQDDGWYLRSDIVWAKPNPMPESVKDRPTRAHEYIFLLTKSERYYYDAAAIAEEASQNTHPGRKDSAPTPKQLECADRKDGQSRSLRQIQTTRNARTVWTITPKPFKGAHFATMPPDLAERCIKAGSKPGDTILDPFGGSGTTALVADRLGRDAVLIDLNASYINMGTDRIVSDAPLFAHVIDR